MNKKLIEEVKNKKIFSGLPDSIVWKFLEKNNLDVKEARADLRKFFGVFITNRVLKGKDEDVLKYHISSKLRDYSYFYDKIFEGFEEIKSVIDLGCGVNGFSYEYIGGIFSGVKYLGIEATGQLVYNMNYYFGESGISSAKVIQEDLFNLSKIIDPIKKYSSPRIILLLQVLDALENVKKNYSKEFLLEIDSILKRKDVVIITMPTKSISGRKKFEAGRKWLRDFLNKNFNLIDEFVLGNERVFRFRKN